MRERRIILFPSHQVGVCFELCWLASNGRRSCQATMVSQRQDARLLFRQGPCSSCKDFSRHVGFLWLSVVRIIPTRHWKRHSAISSMKQGNGSRAFVVFVFVIILKMTLPKSLSVLCSIKFPFEARVWRLLHTIVIGVLGASRILTVVFRRSVRRKRFVFFEMIGQSGASLCHRCADEKWYR